MRSEVALRRLGEVVELEKLSVKPSRGTIYTHFSLPAFDAGRPEVVDGGTIRSAKLVVPERCILMNKLNVRFKRVWAVERPRKNSIASTEFLPLIPKGVDYWYLYYWLRSSETTSRLEAMRSGTSGSHQRVDARAMMGLTIPIPDPQEQRQVGALLRSIDAAILVNQRLNDYLAGAARAYFEKWLSKAEGRLVSVSDIASLNPDTYSIKEKWPVVHYLDTGSITRGILDSYQYIEPENEKLPSRARRKVAAGDIVYSTVRPNQEHYGILLSPDENVLVSTGFTVVRTTDDNVSSELLYLFLTQSQLTQSLHQIAEQSVSTYPSIKAEDLGKLELPLPSAEEARWLNSLLKPLFELMDANQKESERLRELRDVLLPKLMSGEIDVSKIDLTQLNNHLSKTSTRLSECQRSFLPDFKRRDYVAPCVHVHAIVSSVM